MKIICTDAVPTSGAGTYFDREFSGPVPTGWERLNLRETIREHEDRWIAQIQAWHGRLNQCGLAATPWWWTTAASRLVMWLPPVFDDLIIALAIIEIARRGAVSSLHVVRPESAMLALLRELSPEIEIEDQQRSKGSRSSVVPWRSLVNRFKDVIRLCVLPFQRRHGPRRLECDLLVCSLALNTRVLQSTGDHFFGRVFDAKRSASIASIAWLYPLGLKDLPLRSEITSIAATQGRIVLFPDEFLSFGDLVRIFAVLLGIRRAATAIQRSAPPLVIDGMQTAAMGRIFLQRLLLSQMPFSEVKLHFALRRVLRAVGAKCVLYPYEEKGMERAMLRARSSDWTGMRMFGFAHAVPHNGHRFFQTGMQGDAAPPSPDEILVTGPAAASWLVNKAGKDRAKVHVLGSPRHRSQLAPPIAPLDNERMLRVLFLVSAPYEPKRLANLVEQAPGVFDRCILKVRLYPYERIAEQMQGVERLRTMGAPIELENAPLIDQLTWSDVVLFCSTSAGMESMLAGRLTVYVDLNDIFTLDILRDKEGSGVVPRCITAADFSNTMTRIRRMSPGEYAAAVRDQLAFANSIYAPPDCSVFEGLLGVERGFLT